jgi:uncharacterized protein (DUF1330 family)
MHETHVAINVSDDAGYQAYRDAMTPLLAEHGGSFRYDFRIEETLRAEADHPINRVFIICFPSAAAKERFFNNEQYMEVRRTLFDASVSDYTIIAEYER